MEFASSSGEPQHLDLQMFMPSSSSPPPNCGEGRGWAEEEREHMFDKVVTPSDVGKLNRLVIPKQHAEKYFPLDSSSSDKGLFLNFQDSSGKSWRFRYSYWTSSQSYVMTKGWSRFVKDKKLDAGDTVSFLRSKVDNSSLFIDWRRTPHPPLPDHHHSFSFLRPSSSVPWTPLLLPAPNNHHNAHAHHYWMTHGHGYASSSNYSSHHHSYGNNYVLANHHHHTSTHPEAAATTTMSRGVLFNHHHIHGDESNSSSSRRWIDQSSSEAEAASSMVLESVPVVQGKKLRLFGVNMDLQPNNDKGKPSSNSHSNMSLDFHM